jgi:hypothetical protein
MGHSNPHHAGVFLNPTLKPRLFPVDRRALDPIIPGRQLLDRRFAASDRITTGGAPISYLPLYAYFLVLI